MTTLENAQDARRERNAATKYDAFISYSHVADARLASALEKHLEQLAKPWYHLRAISVFRDETALTASPHLWPNITSSLRSSRYLILLASTTAAESKWVRKELCFWISDGTCEDPSQLKPEMIKPSQVERLLIVLTEGDITWDDSTGGHGDFNWQQTNALSRVLSDVFSGEPFWIDLRWARTNVQAELTRSNAEFLKGVAKLSAPIRNLDVETLIGEDYRQQRRT